MNGNDPNRRITVVIGYHECTEVPAEARRNGLLSRFAVVMETYRSWCPSIYFDRELYFALLDCLLGRIGYDSIAITMEDGAILDSVVEAARCIESLPEEDQLPPVQCIVESGGKLICVIATEYWANCGGPDPYHDSYTVSLYTSDDNSKEFSKCCESVCGELGAAIDGLGVGALSPPTRGYGQPGHGRYQR